jgi:hypothetical protein
MTKAEMLSITTMGDLVRRQCDCVDSVPYDCDPARVDAILTKQQISEIRRHHDTMIEVGLVGMGDAGKAALLVLSPLPVKQVEYLHLPIVLLDRRNGLVPD